MSFKDWFKKDPTLDAGGDQVVRIKVDGGYSPSTIKLRAGVPAKLIFTRTSDQGCLGTVQSADLNFKAQLPLNQPVTVRVTPDHTGEYGFACAMNMFKGKVVVD